jgi:hypothetical protein
MLQAQQVRVDAQDNVWIVDQMSTQVIKFDPNGRVQMILSRKPEAMRVPALQLTPLPTGIPVVQTPPPAPPAPTTGAAPAANAPLPGAGAEGESFQRPTDVAWDAGGNIYVADGYGNARIAKYEPTGKYIKSWGSRERRPASSTSFTGSPSMRRAMCTRPTKAIDVCRSSTPTARSRSSS